MRYENMRTSYYNETQNNEERMRRQTRKKMKQIGEKCNINQEVLTFGRKVMLQHMR